ncbi:hypothetical protein OCU04_005676 [Sclerotinia nivalis]|uniref:Uncharacterized protein n=1 Tax=Sclerotinia nivalis TaxID=352851 RepID=A0A9X0APM4_9HELO|nr:hypothetical protein OCU04_005676 [Sclerotinia nivalis]
MPRYLHFLEMFIHNDKLQPSFAEMSNSSLEDDKTFRPFQGGKCVIWHLCSSNRTRKNSNFINFNKKGISYKCAGTSPNPFYVLIMYFLPGNDKNAVNGKILAF